MTVSNYLLSTRHPNRRIAYLLTKMKYTSLIVIFALNFLPQYTYAQPQECHIWANYLLISTQGFSQSSGLDKFNSNAISKIKKATEKNTSDVDKKLSAQIKLCYKGFSIVSIEQLSKVEAIGVDINKWNNYRAKYSGKELPLAIRGEIRKLKNEICARSTLFMGDVADQLQDIFDNPGTTLPDKDGDGVPDSADRCPNQAGNNEGCPVLSGPTLTLASNQTQLNLVPSPPIGSEKVINIIISDCQPSFGFPSKEVVAGVIKSNDIFSIIQENFGRLTGYVGRMVSGGNVSARSNQKSYLQPRRKAIHLRLLSRRRDGTLLHETGHYLGLAHTGHLTIKCIDNDERESGVVDTPPHDGNDYEKFWNKPKSEWPKVPSPTSLCEITLPDGTIDDKQPILNTMNSTPTGDPPWEKQQFSVSQYRVMMRMIELLE